MGWTFQHMDEGGIWSEKIKEFFKKEFEGCKEKILDCEVLSNVAYLVMEKTQEDCKIERYAVVCLLAHHYSEYCNFGYKEEDEGMGPYEFDCPDRLLDLLTNPPNKYAAKWRKRCRVKNSQKREREETNRKVK